MAFRPEMLARTADSYGFNIDLEKMREKVQTTLDRDRIKSNDFMQSPYDPNEVRQDFTEPKESNPDDIKNSELRNAFQAMLHDQIKKAQWFGENVRPMGTAPVDRRKGIDTVLEYKREQGASFMGLGIHVVYTSDQAVIQRSIEDILDNDIESGTLGQVKYFKSEHLNMAGQLQHIPRVVIGAEYNSISKALENWNAAITDENTEKIHWQILWEIKFQLQAYLNYAKELQGSERVDKKKYSNVISRYEESLGHVNQALGEHQAEPAFVKDKVYSSLLASLMKTLQLSPEESQILFKPGKAK